MILYPRRSRPATTCSCSALFRTLVALALTAELVNSLAPEAEPGRHAAPSRRDTGPSGARPEEFGSAEDVAAPSSWSRGKGEELTNNAGLHLRSRDFELTYTVPKTAIDDDEGIVRERQSISDDELIARAIRHKIFPTREEWDARDKHRRVDDVGDDTYANRIGLINIPVPKVKPECWNSLICDEVESYPAEDMEKIAQNLGSLSALASHVSDKVPENRMGDGGNSNTYKSLCNSTTRPYQPMSVRKNLHQASWKTVVKTKKFVQEFYITVCQETDSPCKISGKSLEAPSMYGAGSACRQQYVERRIVVVNNSDARPYVDSFPIPSSCCCHKTGLNMQTARFGGNLDHRHRQPHNARGGPHRHLSDD